MILLKFTHIIHFVKYLIHVQVKVHLCTTAAFSKFLWNVLFHPSRLKYDLCLGPLAFLKKTHDLMFKKDQ